LLVCPEQPQSSEQCDCWKLSESRHTAFHPKNRQYSLENVHRQYFLKIMAGATLKHCSLFFEVTAQ